MKILFIADIHIKIRQKNIPTDWAINRFKMFLEQTAIMQEKADMLILGGDIFDTLPNTLEISLYVDLIKSIKIPTYVYSGNHEAITKTATFLSHLKDLTYHLNDKVTLVDDFHYIEDIDLFIIPYNKLKEDYPRKKGKICCTHVRGEIPPHVKPEIDLDLLSGWELVLAGDLHNRNNSQRNIQYPGSPYTTSFHKEEVETGAILLDTDTLEIEWLKYNLPQLIEKSLEIGEEKYVDGFHHYKYTIVGDMDQLSSVEADELVTKKHINKINDVQLILDSHLSIDQEAAEFMEHILMLNPEAISKALSKLRDECSQELLNDNS